MAKRGLLIGIFVFLILIGFIFFYYHPETFFGNTIRKLIFQAPEKPTPEEMCKNNIVNVLNRYKEVSTVPFSYKILDVKAFSSMKDAIDYGTKEWFLKEPSYNSYIKEVFDPTTFTYKQKIIINGSVIQVICRLEAKTEMGGKIRFTLPLICDSKGNLTKEARELLDIYV